MKIRAKLIFGHRTYVRGLHTKLISKLFIAEKLIKRMNKDNLELADEHIQRAEELLYEESKNADKKEQEKIKEAELSLEKAEAEVEELGGKEE
jgi:hypothetical protein